jgi:hypothetical protein
MPSPHNLSLFQRLDIRSFLGIHEFGLHIHWGGYDSSGNKSLRSLSTDVFTKEMRDAYEACLRMGFRPRSFRGGGLSQTTPVLELVYKHGFVVDSSVAAKLNQSERWFQNHVKVPYKSWYFPSKKGYDIPAIGANDRMGILEIPVTRLIPSLRSWSPYTLTPSTPLVKIITSEWLIRSRWESPLVVTPIFHSYGDGKVRIGRKTFARFLEQLSWMIKYMLKKNLKPHTLSEVYSIICEKG